MHIIARQAPCACYFALAAGAAAPLHQILMMPLRLRGGVVVCIQYFVWV
jgi:hypothetical protein